MLKSGFPKRSLVSVMIAVSIVVAFDVVRADPPETGATTNAAPVAEGAPPAVPEPPVPAPRFDIREYAVNGNTVLTTAQIERAVYPFLGPGKTMVDIQGARKALEGAYRDAGYRTVAVIIPEQQVVGGVVLLQVNEGRVGKVRVKGSRYYLPSRIRDELQALAPGTVLHLPTLQEELAALNRASPDRQVTPVFRAGTTPGTVEVDLRVRDSFPLHGSLELNNRYSANTDPLRLVGTIHYDNLWQREHSLSLLYQTAPQDPHQVTAYSGTYLFRSADAFDMTVLYGLHSSSNLAVVGGTTVIGAGTVVGVREIFTLPAVPGWQQSLSLGVDYKDFGENVNLATDTITTPIRYIPFAVLYTANRYRPGNTWQSNFALNVSVRGLSDQTVDCFGQQLDQFECKRDGASSNYAYVKAEIQNTRDLGRGWVLDLHGDMQVASEPLISNEQYSIGGLTSVRGYLEAERLGDDGWHASVELRTPSWNRGESKSGEVYGLVFYDSATASVQQPLPEQLSHFHLRGTGIGMRFAGWGGLKGELHWAHALDDAVETRRGDNRVQFRVEYGF